MAFALLHELMRSGHLDCATFSVLWQATAEHQAALPPLPRAPEPAPAPIAEKWSLAEKAELKRIVKSRPWHGYPFDGSRDNAKIRRNSAFWLQVSADLAAVYGGAPRTMHAVYRIANQIR